MSQLVMIQSANGKAIFSLPANVDDFLSMQACDSVVQSGGEIAGKFISVGADEFIGVYSVLSEMDSIELLDKRNRTAFYAGREHLIAEEDEITSRRISARTQVEPPSSEISDSQILDSIKTGQTSHAAQLEARENLELAQDQKIEEPLLENSDHIPETASTAFGKENSEEVEIDSDRLVQSADTSASTEPVLVDEPASAAPTTEVSPAEDQEEQPKPKAKRGRKQDTKSEPKKAYSVTSFIKTNPFLIDGAFFQSDSGTRLPQFPSIGVQEKANGKKFDEWLTACGAAIESPGVAAMLAQTDRSDEIYSSLFKEIFGRDQGPDGKHIVKSLKQLEQEEVLKLIDESLARMDIDTMRDAENKFREGKKVAAAIESAIAKTNSPDKSFLAEYSASTSAFALAKKEAAGIEIQPQTIAAQQQAEPLHMGALRYYALVKNNVIVSVGVNDANIQQSIVDMANRMSAQLLWSNSKFEVDAQYLKPPAPSLAIELSERQEAKISEIVLKARAANSRIKCVTAGADEIYIKISAATESKWVSVRQSGQVYMVTNEAKMAELDTLKELVPTITEQEEVKEAMVVSSAP